MCSAVREMGVGRRGWHSDVAKFVAPRAHVRWLSDGMKRKGVESCS